MIKYKSLNQDNRVEYFVILPEDVVIELLENPKNILHNLSINQPLFYNLSKVCQSTFAKFDNMIDVLESVIIQLLERSKKRRTL